MMKRAVIIFLLLLIFTLLVPIAAVIKSEKSEETDELVTLFSSHITLPETAHTCPFDIVRAAD